MRVIKIELVEACHELVEWGECQSAHGSTVRLFDKLTAHHERFD